MEFNLADLFERVADTVPEREALVCGDRRMTYAELDERSTRFAHALVERGIGAGDHVGLQLRNRRESVEAMLACFKLRAVPVNVNWRYVGAELEFLCSDAGLVALLYHPAAAGTVEEVARRTPSLRLLVVVDEPADTADGPSDRSGPDAVTREGGDVTGVVAGIVSYDAALASGSAARDFGPRSADDRYVLYTGGTTGFPKGVVWRQEDIFFAVLGGGNPGGEPITSPDDIARTVVENRAQRLAPLLPPGDPGPEQFVQLALGPLMHASGQWSALGTLLGGGKVVLYPYRHVDMIRVLDLVEAERVTALNLVGDASARPLLDAVEARPGVWDTSSLRLLGSGGTMLSGDVKTRLLRGFPTVVAITEAVGSSEAPVQGVSVTTRDGPAPESLRFVTRDGTIVLDDELRPVEPGSGVVGRLATRGRVPLGYHNDASKTEATFVEIDGERWALPGDMAAVEADGTLRLVGRGALCINTGGEKVYPEEVEAVLAGHPAVADVVVVGAEDPRWGERVAAVVQPADPDAPPDLEALQEHCRERLAGYKVPRALHLVDVVVRTAVGKPDYPWAAQVAGNRPSQR